MDLSLIKQKLTNLSQKGNQPKYEKVDFSKIIWKPKPGKYQVRIIPSVRNKSNPFHEVFIHYGISKFPIYALTNWEEQDPIVEFAKQLKKSGDKEDWMLATKISPKMRIFVPLIVRGEEEAGVRLWEFGKVTYQQLLTLADDEDYGDFTDVNEGRDFTITAAEEQSMNKTIIKCTLTIKPKTSVATTNGEQLENWLNIQPDILAANRKYSFEELKDILQKFLAPEEETNQSDIVSSDNEHLGDDLPFVVDDKTTKKNSKDKFDQLFSK